MIQASSSTQEEEQKGGTLEQMEQGKEEEEAFRSFLDTEQAPPTPEEIDALYELLGRDWWRRIWIVQEVAVAKKRLLSAAARSLNGAP